MPSQRAGAERRSGPRDLSGCQFSSPVALTGEASPYSGMKTFIVVPRGKKYWVEEVGEDGSRRIVLGFGTEEAALTCRRDLQDKADRAAFPPSANRFHEL
jgi:hypothetical protein